AREDDLRNSAALLVAPLRPDDLPLASNTLGGRGKRNDDCGGRLRRWQERVEKHCGRQKPEVDRSAEHWLFLSSGAERLQAASNCPRALSGTIRGVDIARRASTNYLTIRYFLA